MKQIDEVLKYSGHLSLLYISCTDGENEDLKKMFPNMQIALSLEEAVEKYHHHEKARNRFFDVVMVDCEMGIAVCRSVLGWNGLGKLIVIRDKGCDIDPYLEMGLSAFLARSLPFERLAESVFSFCKEIYHKHRLQQYVHAYDLLKQEYEKSRKEWEEKYVAIERNLRHKSDFLAGMSHEIRTPMNAVIGLGHLLLQEELNEKARDYALKINGSAEMLMGIVNDLLDYSKIEAGKLKIEAIEFDLNIVLDHVADMVGLAVHEKGLELIFDIEHRVRPNYIGDPTRISQIILNLMNNAVKFTQQGEITLKIDTLVCDENHHKLQFEVSDTGIGMSDEQTKQLFERYVQAEDSTARKFGGTGLGLSICKELVELMGGRIWVKSKAGVGSTFGFVLELGVSHPSERRIYHLVHKELMQMKILIVDSHPNATEALHRMIGYFHMGIDVADSLHEAKQLLEHQLYDMVFIGEQMTELSTAPLFSKEHSPRIVLLVSRMGNPKRTIWGDYAIDAYLQKPFTQQTVLNLFNEMYGVKEPPYPLPKPHVSKKDLTRFSGSRILMAEDNVINQKVMIGLLSDTGITLDVVEDGLAALQSVRSNGPYELMLMDINMPVMNGYDSADAIRHIYNDATMPIIALSADTAAEDIQKAKEHGMQGHLAKPIDIVSLYDLLYRYLDKAKEKAETPSPKPAGHSDDDKRFNRLAQIPNFDWEGALERSGGSKTLFLSLIEDFVTLYKKAPEQIRLFNAQQRYEDGLHYVHDLKGAAGSIGSIRLFKRAKELEEFYRRHDDRSLEAAVEGFEVAINTAMGEIEEALCSTDREKGADKVDGDRYALLVNLLNAARKKKVLECVSIIGKIRETPWPRSYYETLNRVIGALKNYRFNEAVEWLEKMEIDDRDMG